MLAIGTLLALIVASADSNSHRRQLQTVYDPECPWKIKCYVIMDSHLLGGKSNGAAIEFTFNETSRVHTGEFCVKTYDNNITIIGEMADAEYFNEHKKEKKEETNQTRRILQEATEKEKDAMVPGMCSHGGFVVVCYDVLGNNTNPLATLVSSVSGWMVQGSDTQLTLDNINETKWTTPKASSRYARGWGRSLMGTYLMVNDTFLLEGRAQQLCDHNNSRYVAFRYVQESETLPLWAQIVVPGALILIVGGLAYKDKQAEEERGGKPTRVMYYSDSDSSSDAKTRLSSTELARRKKMKEARKKKEALRKKRDEKEAQKKKVKSSKKSTAKASKKSNPKPSTKSTAKEKKSAAKDSKKDKNSKDAKTNLVGVKLNLNNNGGRIPQQFFASTLRSEDFESLSAKRRKPTNSSRVSPQSSFPVGGSPTASRTPRSHLRPIPQKSNKTRERPKRERMEDISEESSDYSPPTKEPKVKGLATWSQLLRG
eukprot:GEMP01009194.1.p1 GENE.GEMP01009194.1~~GEMP01009194.1.p1  ORF type:complete len:484 (+),score=80.97 GEMP01009194.1:407-1858(+)